MNLLQRQPAPAITLHLLVCLTIVVLPHTPHLSPWIWGLCAVLVVWRGLAALRHWPMPPRWTRLLLALAVFVGVYLTYGRINGQQGGVALLVALLAVKLTELDSLRDHVVAALLAYFVLISQFLFSQELVMILWLAAGAWLVTATLLSISHPHTALPYKVSLTRSATLLLQAAPLMLIFFVLFPRIPGPLWGLPSDSGASRSGLSDSMTPGDISHLVTTDEIAFRVIFDGPAPPPQQRYWRGPVFEFFDGRSWRQNSIYTSGAAEARPTVRQPLDLLSDAETLRYEITMEPNRRQWLFALDMPVQGPPDAHIGRDGLMLASDPVNERRLYAAESVPTYQLEPELSAKVRERTLSLPGQANPRTRELARQWRERGLNDRQIVNRALQRYREQSYIYTLQPPRLGADAVDGFLFETRRGFCEHFSSSFAYLMRAAGIPTRIVTGYQGGERNEVGGYYILRQSDAHAWVEVWLEGRGWLRIDPTAAVAPERIERGLQAALPVGEAMAAAIARRSGEGLLHDLRMRWDWVNNSWYRWVLAYGPELQSKLLSRFGLYDWGSMILALTLMVTAFLAGLGLLLVWQMQRPAVDDPVQRLWLRFCRKMKRRGLARAPHEGPRDYGERLVEKWPEQAAAIRRITQLYIRLRYGDTARRNDNAMLEFRQAIKGLG